MQIFADNDKTIAALAGLNLIPARWFRMPGKERKRKERRKEGRKEERKEEIKKEGRKKLNRKEKVKNTKRKKMLFSIRCIMKFL